MRALILANGDPPSPGVLRTLISEHELFLVTDGAAQHIPVDLLDSAVVIGDFDSISHHARASLDPHRTLHLSDQENSDLEKAILHALQVGCIEMLIAGATGSRMDHTLTAFSLLVKYHRKCPIQLLTTDGWARAVSDRLAWTGQQGDLVSLVQFEPVSGVSLEGVEWPLNDENLEPGSRTVSNRMSCESAELTIRSGVAILIVSNKA